MRIVPIKILLLLTIIITTLISLSGCNRVQPTARTGKLLVVTTLFPLYDFVKNIGGELVETSLLLPPGVEPHNFEPSPEDLMKVAKADIFIYTNREMEPWAEKLVSGVTKAGKPVRLEAGSGARYIGVAASETDSHSGHNEAAVTRDPHIWLDINNAMLMIDRTAGALAAAAPSKKDTFIANAAAYKKKLQQLSERYRSGLADCSTREFIHGGHFAFAYLADCYHLKYIAAYGISADSEPTPRRIIELVDTIRKHQSKYIFYEELLSPRVAQTVAAETGAGLLKLHGLHNISSSEFESGATYLSLMEQNLTALRKGLSCQ